MKITHARCVDTDKYQLPIKQVKDTIQISMILIDLTTKRKRLNMLNISGHNGGIVDLYKCKNTALAFSLLFACSHLTFHYIYLAQHFVSNHLMATYNIQLHIVL